MYKGGIKIFLLFIIVIVLFISSIFFSYDSQELKENVQTKAQEAIETGSEKVVNKVMEEGRTAVGEKLKETGEKMLVVENNQPGVFKKYGGSIIGDYQYTVLFFTAEWCPSCIIAQKNIEEFKSTIPTDVMIVAVDYDQNKELREKYAVNKQHTFVLLDCDHVEMTKWENSSSVNEIIEHIK